jgi:hypothetical protein
MQVLMSCSLKYDSDKTMYNNVSFLNARQVIPAESFCFMTFEVLQIIKNVVGLHPFGVRPLIISYL